MVTVVKGILETIALRVDEIADEDSLIEFLIAKEDLDKYLEKFNINEEITL